MHDPVAACGQIWADCEQTKLGRMVRIEQICESPRGAVATCSVVADVRGTSPEKSRIGAKTTILVRRLRSSGSYGYRFVPHWVAVIAYTNRWSNDGKVKIRSFDVGDPNASSVAHLYLHGRDDVVAGDVTSLEVLPSGQVIARGTLYEQQDLTDLIPVPEFRYTDELVYGDDGESDEEPGSVYQMAKLVCLRAGRRQDGCRRQWSLVRFEMSMAIQLQDPAPDRGW